MALIIDRATLDDLPALAEINRSAYHREATAQFAFKNWPDERNMFEFFKARLAERLTHPHSQVFKAIDTTSGRALGFICLTLERGTKEVAVGVGAQQTPLAAAESSSPTAKLMQQIPPYFNKDFVVTTGGEVEQMRSLMEGQPHYYISAFAVDSRNQGMGIGSQLLKHCLDIADQSTLRTWLISFPGSHSLYLRSGFEDRDHRDIDLNAWDDDKLRGFGVYRQFAMVRDCPSSVERNPEDYL